MAGNLQFATIPDETKERIKRFRFRKSKTVAAIILKINNTDAVVVEEEFDSSDEDCSIEELREEICDTQPRYVVISYKYKYDDGHTSYPLFFVYYSPPGCKMEMQMKYAGTKQKLQEELGITKSLDVQDLEEEGFSSEWLDSKVQFYR